MGPRCPLNNSSFPVDELHAPAYEGMGSECVRIEVVLNRRYDV